nr:uncharacterized protein LOC123760420 [Procambarus clarkii]
MKYDLVYNITKVDQGSTKMALPTLRVKSCIGCIPLQRGTVIIGFLALFGSLLEIFKCVLRLVDFELSLKQCQQAEKTLLVRPTILVYLDNSTEDDDDDDDDHHDLASEKCPTGAVINIIRIATVLRAFTYFIYFILTDKPSLMTPWLGWQLVQITFIILALFGLVGNINDIISSIFLVIVVIYFFLVVNSYYLQLRESASQSADLTVVAVAHPNMDMTVTIPSPRKDDPPPPYPGLTSGYNPVYNPIDITGYPPAPPYTPRQNNDPVYPPPYENNIANPSVEGSHVGLQSQELHAGAASRDPSPQAAEEVAPLVEKQPIPKT